MHEFAVNDLPSIPSSAVVAAATRYARELCPPFLLNHAVRTFHLADAIGRRDGLRYDPEVLYVASVLHDIGLTGRLEGAERFEIAGADAAETFALANGVSEAKAELIWDAIALHTSMGIATRNAPEVALVFLGSATDLGGVGLDRLPAAVVAWIMSEYPRLGARDAILGLVLDEVRRKPEAAAFTWLADVGRTELPAFRCPTFREVLAASPFAE